MVDSVVKLDKDHIFVIESNTPCYVLFSAEGKQVLTGKMLNVTKEEGPIKIYGKFVGNDRPSTRTFKSKHVYLVTVGEMSGKVEMIVVPQQVTKETDVKRKTFEVFAGEGPRPPPVDPVEPPNPSPNPPGPTASKLKIVICEDLFLRTPAIASVVNDPDFRKWAKDNGHRVETMSIRDTVYTEGGFKKYAEDTGLPSVIILDLNGPNSQVPLTAFKLPSSGAELKTLCDKVVKK